ncbi:MAG: hypothetical protein PHS41_03345 [Victivallaceae bacterium]|nr:hypothetical protein [Victivallaceae bacterium]
MKYTTTAGNVLSSALATLVLASCQSPNSGDSTSKETIRPSYQQNTSTTPQELILSPRAIPGTPRAMNSATTGGYAPSNIQAQLKIDVKEGTREVKVIRDNTDPYVITKPYKILHADPYAVRSYLEAAVGAKSVENSPAQATAVKFDDGTGVVLVSAEEYRFRDTEKGRGIDSIVATLDRKGLTYAPDAETRIYFPKISRAANLRDMLLKVGSSELDPEFAAAPGTILVDAELNALIVKAPKWNWHDMRLMLEKYDRPIPEVKVTYRVLEIYAENDDRIGVDFQSWKNNEGVDFFSAGALVSRNWGTFFASGVQDTGNNRVSYWNFNPKWNTRYLDFMTSIGKAKCLARGVLVAQNRVVSRIQVNSGFFYDRTYYTAGASSIAEACTEFTYTNPNPDTIQREAITKILSYSDLVKLYREAGSAAVLVPTGYTMRMMNTQTGTNTYGDATAKLTGNDNATDKLAKYLTGYVKADGTVVNGTYYNDNGDYMNASPGIIHGWLQYPMVTDGFKFDLTITPIVTGRAAKLKFDLSGISLLGWNSDGSARTSRSETGTTVQIGYDAREFVIGGLRKSESVRSTTGLPYIKDIPVLGRAFSTESESIKQSQLVLIAKVEYSQPDVPLGSEIRDNLGKIIKGVNKGMTSRVGNMFFQQYELDEDRKPREERLDAVGTMINDDYQELK